MEYAAEENKEKDTCHEGPVAADVQHKASWSELEGTLAPEQDSAAVEDAADDIDTTSCGERPASLQLEFQELLEA